MLDASLDALWTGKLPEMRALLMQRFQSGVEEVAPGSWDEPERALVTFTSVAFVRITFRRAPFSLSSLMSPIHHVAVPEPTKREKIVAAQSWVQALSNGEAKVPSAVIHSPFVLARVLPKLAELSLRRPSPAQAHGRCH